MTNNKKAFKEAEKELQKDKINEIKEMMKSILQKIYDEKDKKAKAEENLRLLKLDMEDLRNGKIEKIKNRHDTSKKARDISPLKEIDLNGLQNWQSYNGTALTVTNALNSQATAATLAMTALPQSQQSINFQDATSGNYFITGSDGQVKEINL